MADSTIGDLDTATSITDDDLFLLEHSSTAMNLKGATIRSYAEKAAGSVKKGDTGASMSGMKLVSGTHAAGTSDTYHVLLDDGTELTTDIEIYNGANGSGAVDSVNGRTGAIELTPSDVDVSMSDLGNSGVSLTIGDSTQNVAKQSVMNTVYSTAESAYLWAYTNMKCGTLVKSFSSGLCAIPFSELGIVTRPTVMVLTSQSDHLIMQYNFDESSSEVHVYAYTFDGTAVTSTIRFCFVLYTENHME